MQPAREYKMLTGGMEDGRDIERVQYDPDGLEEASCSVGAEGGDAQSKEPGSWTGTSEKNRKAGLEIKTWGVGST